MMRPSPLQNRVAPDGSLHADPARGLMMGNRGGRLHRTDGTLGAARWRGRAWIACRLAFGGRHRNVWGESYTELFFLDEATALAAGHRPCFECRRAEARAFAAAWDQPAPRAAEMDAVLHGERQGPRDRVAVGDLPFASIFAAEGCFLLRTGRGCRRWSFSGYGPEMPLDGRTVVAAVTPRSIRAVLAAGYRPMLHPSCP